MPALLLVAAYLIGAIPFGWLIGRARGVDLFKEGSGNIGATNAARVLGRKTGIAVFVLDFLKGAMPVAAAGWLDQDNAVRAGAAALAFLGHIFPIYLGFRGGKGVATGAGTIFVLVPIPAALAVAAWITVVLATRFVAAASIAAVVVLVATHLATAASPFAPETLPIALYVLIGTVFVIVKHRSNIARLRAGTESQLRDFSMRETLVRGLHILALGFWFGGAAFFNFVIAPTLFQSFDAVAKAGPTDRTAHYDITKGIEAQNEKEFETKKESLGKALAGSAVGPIFPKYFAMQLGCCFVSLATAFAWWKLGRVHRRRVLLLAAALVLIGVSIPISNHVTELRLLRFNPDAAAAAKAVEDFKTWHLASLALSMVTVLMAGVALAMAAALPDRTTNR
jgi:acyl-phosphate glycerol 3-phosphate acyltransferase